LGTAINQFSEIKTASNHLRTAKALPKPKLRLLYAMLGELPIATDAGKQGPKFAMQRKQIFRAGS